MTYEVSTPELVASLQDLIRSKGGDVKSLIPEGQRRTVPGETTTAASSLDRERAGLALIHESLSAPPGTEPDLGAALSRAGMAPEMFLEMTDAPDFWEQWKDLNRRYFFIARLPQYLQGLSYRAFSGDAKAFSAMSTFFGEDVAERWNETTKRLLKASDESVANHIRLTIRELQQLLLDVEKQEEAHVAAQQAVQQAAVKAATVRKIR